jgi:carboxylesterase type B
MELYLGINHILNDFKLTSRPRCPQVYSPPELWIQETFPKTAMQPREYTWDEFRCTNLNIFFPAGAIQNNSHFQNLPVMVNIHGISPPEPDYSLVVGGSYKVGSGNEPRHDGTGLVKGGVEIGKPVVVVTVK